MALPHFNQPQPNYGRQAMKITVRTVGDARILDCNGKITMGEPTMALRNTIHDILQGGTTKIILNLAHISFIDSSGIGELVHAYNAISNIGGQFKLLNLKKKIWDPLMITKLLTVFETYEDEQAALLSFKQAS
jgi:anti-sigma B factor antagonist